MAVRTKKVNEIHTDEAQQDGVPILAPGIYGLLGGTLLARPEQVSWLESHGYVKIDQDYGVCSFTEAGAAWLDSIADDDVTMGTYFYKPTDDVSDAISSIFGTEDSDIDIDTV